MQTFYIKKDSLNPLLRMELVKNGRYDFNHSIINNALQDSEVFFSMKNSETGIMKIINAPAEIVLANSDSCEEHYILEYKWNKRDVNKEGFYDGWFEIKFNGNIKEDGIEYPMGNLKVPIEDDLRIVIK